MKYNRDSKDLNKRNNFFPIYRLFPNIITIAALCCGMSAIRFAISAKWENAVIFIIIAAFLDGIDGKLARLLKASTSFGAQLDSLADFLSFGIAPAILIYLWHIQHIQAKTIGWAISLIYTICCAVRLARFNTIMDDIDKPAWTNKFFVGVPSPVAACLTLIPLMIEFEYNIKINSFLLLLYMLSIGLLMASRVPTFYVKKISIKQGLTSIALVFSGLIIASLIVEPWVTLPIIGLTYCFSIPISIYQFKKEIKNF